MSILGNDLLLAGTDEGYNLTRSLRFRNSASAYLSRTPASTTNRTTATYSGWIKRGALNSTQQIFQQGDANANTNFIEFGNDSGGAGDFLCITDYNSGSYKVHLVSTAVYRDPSAWYHIVVAYDTTQATAANRVKVWVNNVQVTAWTTADYPAQNATLVLNTTASMFIGKWWTTSRHFDGYMTEINFIDGQALTPSSFGETDTITGVWKPKRYAGTYGTNGFYLPFTDNSALTTSSNVGLGKDFSGNGNYWTTNNISITSGITYDSMTDVPTLTSATAANFAVLNPLKNYNNTIADGNLTISSTSSSTTTIVLATIGMSSGKWYWEFTQTSFTVNNTPMIGVAKDNVSMTAYVGSDANGWAYFGNNGQKFNNGTGTAYGASYTNNDVIGVAFDATAGTLVFYKNNVSQGTAFSGLTSGPYFPAFSDGGSTTVMTANVNFGQRPFAYTPPTGYVALNTYNLPTGTILKGNTVMDATTYTGNGSTLAVTNAAGFRPDLVWYKARSFAYNNSLFDSVRGATKQLISNTIDAEATLSGVTAFNSNGFSLGNSVNGNNNGTTYVGWQWQAGQGTTSSNTNGTITSTVSVNASAGFSIVTYTGNNINPSTVGHGLGVAPSWVIVKPINTAVYNWNTYHISLGNTQFIALNTDSAASSSVSLWNNTSPTSTVFTINYIAVNTSATTYVAYCWAPIAGYSAFGSYTGNGSSDGPFVYTGFRPKFVMIKEITSGGTNWNILDTSRDPYNVEQKYLAANLSDAEGTLALLDGLSNGFKLRSSAVGTNASGSTYIYAAFAENPFKNSLAR